MDRQLTCRNGHRWQAPSGSSPTGVCPLCGAAGIAELADAAVYEPTAVSEPSTDSTQVYETQSGASLGAGQALPAPVPGDFPYEILEMLGRGGVGVVYKARDTRLDRIVAVKMLHLGSESPRAIARFKVEARAIASLRHPNIVQVFQIGEIENRPFLVLEFVAGETLAKAIKRREFPPAEAAALVKQLAEAVGYAHERGILHRDLKPANILLSENVTPKIVDFGLAKHLAGEGRSEQAEDLTASGEVLGTPSYMAPEQARSAGEVGPQTDVYALGAILYELLTRRPPFAGDSVMDTLMLVLHEPPKPPREVNPAIPSDLEAICLKCLAKSPADRYSNAAELARDLGAFLVDERVSARPASSLRRFLGEWIRWPGAAISLAVAAVATIGLLSWGNNPVVAAGCAVVLGAVVTGSWCSARIARAKRDARSNRRDASRLIKRFELLLELTRELVQAESLEEVLYHLSDAAARLLDAERATVYLVDGEKKELWSLVALGDGVGEIRVRLGEGIAGTVAMTGEVINLNDPYRDSRFNPDVDRRTGYKTRNLLTLPMIAQDERITGVFQVLNKRDGRFTADDVALLQSLASTASVFVEKMVKE